MAALAGRAIKLKQTSQAAGGASGACTRSLQAVSGRLRRREASGEEGLPGLAYLGPGCAVWRSSARQSG